MMKALQKYLLLAAMLVSCGSAAVDQRSAFIAIVGNTVGIDNLLLQDSLAGSKYIYTASFDMSISDGVSLQQILNSLQVAYFKNT
ncbi:MAG: hypothetical protein H7Y86_18640 [Rhizobacter sp.]|nr:hypothetical protein [Ferruginibacter sp.]